VIPFHLDFAKINDYLTN